MRLPYTLSSRLSLTYGHQALNGSKRVQAHYTAPYTAHLHRTAVTPTTGLSVLNCAVAGAGGDVGVYAMQKVALTATRSAAEKVVEHGADVTKYDCY